MDKVFSARVDEQVLRRLGMLSRRLGIPKKAVFERAVACYAESLDAELERDLLAESFAGWQRDESPEETVEQVRSEFRSSMERHQR